MLLLPLVSEELEPELLPELLLLGDSAAPVAELAPERPKKEYTLCFQLGCERSVVESKLGADCSLLWSPVNWKLT